MMQQPRRNLPPTLPHQPRCVKAPPRPMRIPLILPQVAQNPPHQPMPPSPESKISHKPKTTPTTIISTVGYAVHTSLLFLKQKQANACSATSALSAVKKFVAKLFLKSASFCVNQRLKLAACLYLRAKKHNRAKISPFSATIKSTTPYNQTNKKFQNFPIFTSPPPQNRAKTPLEHQTWVPPFCVPQRGALLTADCFSPPFPLFITHPHCHPGPRRGPKPQRG